MKAKKSLVWSLFVFLLLGCAEGDIATVDELVGEEYYAQFFYKETVMNAEEDISEFDLLVGAADVAFGNPLRTVSIQYHLALAPNHRFKLAYFLEGYQKFSGQWSVEGEKLILGAIGYALPTRNAEGESGIQVMLDRDVENLVVPNEVNMLFRRLTVIKLTSVYRP